MKTTKLITALFISFLFTNLLYAVTPSNENLEKKKEIIVERISKDIVLTDKQKDDIELKEAAFYAKIEKLKLSTNEDEKKAKKKEAYNDYKLALDSILTDNQKARLMEKQSERLNANKGKHRIRK